jgi:colanic acid biosynthesis glycosyl transferase WcaI
MLNQEKILNLKKHVLIIGANYYPEDSAIGLYTTQKAEYLAANGFQVTIITGFPYYPQWNIFQPYKRLKKTFFEENINGVKILRYRQYVPNNPKFLNRIWHILSFTMGMIVNLFKITKPDVFLAIAA